MTLPKKISPTRFAQKILSSIFSVSGFLNVGRGFFYHGFRSGSDSLICGMSPAYRYETDEKQSKHPFKEGLNMHGLIKRSS